MLASRNACLTRGVEPSVSGQEQGHRTADWVRHDGLGARPPGSSQGPSQRTWYASQCIGDLRLLLLDGLMFLITGQFGWRIRYARYHLSGLLALQESLQSICQYVTRPASVPGTPAPRSGQALDLD